MNGGLGGVASRRSCCWLLVLLLCATTAPTAVANGGQHPNRNQQQQQHQEQNYVVTSGQTAVAIGRLTGAVVTVTVRGIEKVCNGTQRIPSSSLSLGSEVQLHVDRVAATNNTVTVFLEATRLTDFHNRGTPNVGPDAFVTVVYRADAAHLNTVLVDVSVHGTTAGGFWSAPVGFALGCGQSSVWQFWTAWSHACMTCEPTRDPLLPIAASALPPQGQAYAYGASCANSCATPSAAVPLLALLDNASDTGVTLALAPTSNLPSIDMSSSGYIVVHADLRITPSSPLRLGFALFGTRACPRDVLRAYSTTYPDVFEPPNPNVHARASGMGTYSAADIPNHANATTLASLAYRVNWDAHFWWPYIGMFLPPAVASETWPNNAHALQRKTSSFATIDAYYAQMAAQNLTVVSYFNVAEFGQNMGDYVPSDELLPGSESSTNTDDWRNATLYVRNHLDAAIPRTLDGRRNIHLGWDGDLTLDATVPAYQDYLVAQAQRHLDALPHFMGLGVDRTLYSGANNFAGDDGVSATKLANGTWRALSTGLQAWHQAMRRVSALMHDHDKIITYNVLTGPRIDLLPYIDAIFTEEPSSHQLAVTQVGWLALRKPAIMWTYSAQDLATPDADAYFQRLLVQGVFPMVPRQYADHSITPTPSIVATYEAYGHLFRALAGRQWVLRPHLVQVRVFRDLGNAQDKGSGRGDQAPHVRDVDPLPSLVPCNTGDPRQAWDVAPASVPGTVRVASRGCPGRCLEVYSPTFSPTSCTAHGGEVAWVYPCGHRRGRGRPSTTPESGHDYHVNGTGGDPEPDGGRAGACPQQANVVWARNTSTLTLRSPVKPGAFCLDAGILSLQPCSETGTDLAQQWTVSKTGALSPASDPTRCLSCAPPLPPVEPPRANVFRLHGSGSARTNSTWVVPVVAYGSQQFGNQTAVEVRLANLDAGVRSIDVAVAWPGSHTFVPWSKLAFNPATKTLVVNASLLRGAAVLSINQHF